MIEDYRKVCAVIMAGSSDPDGALSRLGADYSGYTLIEWAIAAIPISLRSRLAVVGIDAPDILPRDICTERPVENLKWIAGKPQVQGDARGLPALLRDDAFSSCEFIYLTSPLMPNLRPSAFECLAENYQDGSDEALCFTRVAKGDGEGARLSLYPLPALVSRAALRRVFERGEIEGEHLGSLFERLAVRALDANEMQRYGISESDLSVTD